MTVSTESPERGPAGIAADGTSHFHLLAKPAGAACNLSCKYCFFLSKEHLYGERESPLMSAATLETYLRQLFETSAGPEVQVAWQGGEPMLRGLDFFKRSVELANRFRKPHQRIQYTLQTNGTLVDDEWAAFFKANDFLVGLSVDGPRALHDAYRIDKRGAGTFDEVIHGWNLLQAHGVETNILCTVHAANVDHPLEVYRFFRDELKAAYVQLIPIVERATGQTIEQANQGWRGVHGKHRPLYKQEGNLVTERTVPSLRFGEFLNAIFDEWIKRDVGTVYVTTFDVALGSWMGQHNSCVVSPTCGVAPVLEHNGDVYSCDHFVEPEHLLGNLGDTTLATLLASEKQRRFGNAKFDTLPKYCRECPVLFACYGECPRNRFIKTPDGEDGLNYLCAGYRAFFTHIDAPMKAMASLLRQGRYADEIMQERCEA
ncbi:MAG TPA: anaerobic sulfatase maturase [Thermomonas sp.]|nr:anaerobic sulfatase maturase [Thermomonas sp.]